MTINRRTKFRPGSLDASIIKPDTGLLLDVETGQLSAEDLVAEDIILHGRINGLYWKDPLNTLEQLAAKPIEDYRVGEAYYVKETNQIYVYGGIPVNIPEGTDVYQPPAWVSAVRQEVFFPVAVGLDKASLATKAYVNTQITNLIDGAPSVLDTLNELAAAIGDDPNYAATILTTTDNLQNTKADKDDVYTKAEVDQKDGNIIANIQTLDLKARRLTDYVVGSGPYADSDDIAIILSGSQTSTTNYKVFYLRKGVLAPPVLNINQPGAILVSFDKEIALLNTVKVNLTDTTLNDFVILKDLKIQTLTLDLTSSPCTLYVKNCEISTLNVLGPDSIVIVENSKITLKADTSASLLKIKDSIIGQDSAISGVFDTNLTSVVEVSNSTIKGYIRIYDSSRFYSKNNSIVINSSSFNFFVLEEAASFLSLEDTSFLSPDGYSANHIVGFGTRTLYANLNNYDVRINSALDNDGSYTSKVRVASTINNGAGIPVANFYLPLGYQDLNDERARDTIATMITGHSLNDSGIVWQYNDFGDTLALKLNISTANLADKNNIAYRNQSNTFTEANTFSGLVKANGGLNTTALNANNVISTNGTFTNLTTATQDINDNSTKVATTAFVQAKYSQLEANLQNLGLDDLTDVTITDPAQKHVLTYIPATTLASYQWKNKQLNSFDLSDALTLVRQGDTVFRLADIDRPGILDQSGSNVGPMNAWPSTSQILRWNGQQYDNPAPLTTGAGQWVVDFANNPILKAGQEPIGPAGYDGWGKIALANLEEVRDGNNDTKAVVPSLLHTHYASITLSNLNPLQIQAARENIGFPQQGDQGHYLIWNNDKWENIDVAKPTYYKTSTSNAAITGQRGYFYNVTATTLTTFTMPTTEQGDLVVRKNNSTGTIRFASTVNFLSSDNQLLQHFDIVSEGHLIEFKYIPHAGSNVWLAQGYYQSSTNGVIDTELIQDAAAALFQHADHAPAINLGYPDEQHKITLNINYADDQQAIAGTISNLPVTPAGLKAALNASVPQGVLLAANNLSDLASKETARTSLGLGSAALVNVTNNAGGILTLVSPLEVGKTILFNGAGLVSGDALPPLATEQNPGLVTLGQATDPPTSTDVITLNLLNTLLNNNSSWLVNLISNISGGGSGLTYTPMNNQTFTASISTYYSLSTPNGSIIITLPAISTLNFGNRVEFKFTNKFPATTITINRSASDTIDKNYTEIELVEEGQHIALIAGINNNWEIA